VKSVVIKYIQKADPAFNVQVVAPSM